MSKMISDGTINQVGCGNCGAIIAYSAADIRHRHDPPSGGFEEEGSDNYAIDCLGCHLPINVTYVTNQKMRNAAKEYALVKRKE